MAEKDRKRNGVMMKDHKEEPQDSINRLPDEVFITILSKVPIDDAIRSSSLSKRWRFLWRQTVRLDFDVEHILQPLTRINISPYAKSNFISNLDTQTG
ncbi:Leucine-rich repeat domain superfamily [Sesbania bispinosa]|nr:Leucine-rich repeat domain superfamily [Sesbania bispinosa]